MPRTLVLIRGQCRRLISLRPSLDLRDILRLSACVGVKNGQEEYHACDTLEHMSARGSGSKTAADWYWLA